MGPSNWNVLSMNIQASLSDTNNLMKTNSVQCLNNDGKISSKELQDGLKSTGLKFTSEEVDVILLLLI